MLAILRQIIQPPPFPANRAVRIFYIAAEIFIPASLLLAVLFPQPQSPYFWVMFVMNFLLAGAMFSLKRASLEVFDQKDTQVELAGLRLQTGYLTALHDTALALVNRLDHGDLIESILVRACEITDTPHGFLELISPDGCVLRQEIGLGMFQRFSGMSTEKGKGITGRVWESGQPLVIEDYETWEFRSPGFSVGFRAGIAIPLISDNEVFGVFGMAYTEPGRVFSPAQVELMQRFAALAVLAIKNTRLYQAARAEIEERKQIANALRQSEDRLSGVINHIPLDLWVCDAEGRYVMQNAVSMKISPNVIGKTALELDEIPSELRERWHHEHMVALSGKKFTGEAVEEDKVGEKRHYIITIAPIYSAGAIIGLVGMSVDVTEIKNAEENYRLLNIELERRVAERTAQLEVANKELEAFAYSVSHDLRAPLRSITGYTRILLNDFSSHLPEEARQFLAKVNESGLKMGTLIDDLLAFSRMGRQQLRRSPASLVDLAHATFAELYPGDEAGHKIEFVVADLPVVQADHAMLKQVMANLISNAIKYSRPRETAHIEVGCFQKDDRDVIFIRDNGVGFDMRYADKLFGVFQRLHSESEFEGTGVGLALVQRIIHRHGGEIWAESEPGHGATFFFTIGNES